MTSMPHLPIHTFHIRVPKSRLRVQVRIFNSRRAMLRGIRADCIGGISNATLACTVYQTKSTLLDNTLAAIVFLARGNMDQGTVAHEFVHAAHNVLERKKGKKKKPDAIEEALADMTGDLVNAFYKATL